MVVGEIRSVLAVVSVCFIENSFLRQMNECLNQLKATPSALLVQ